MNATLRYLWLNGKELTGVDRRLEPLLFHTLLHLRLDSNPLRCNCELVWLKKFYDRTVDVFRGAVPPACHSPARLKGRRFDEVSLFDFRCHPPSFKDVEVSFAATAARLRCTATGDPAPIIYWIQPSGKTTMY